MIEKVKNEFGMSKNISITIYRRGVVISQYPKSYLFEWEFDENE